jgi:hypothetical protein
LRFKSNNNLSNLLAPNGDDEYGFYDKTHPARYLAGGIPTQSGFQKELDIIALLPMLYVFFANPDIVNAVRIAVWNVDSDTQGHYDCTRR